MWRRRASVAWGRSGVGPSGEGPAPFPACATAPFAGAAPFAVAAPVSVAGPRAARALTPSVRPTASAHASSSAKLTAIPIRPKSANVSIT